MTTDAFSAAETFLLKYEIMYAERMVKNEEKSQPSKDEAKVLDDLCEVLSAAFWPEWLALTRVKSGDLAHPYHKMMVKTIEGMFFQHLTCISTSAY